MSSLLERIDSIKKFFDDEANSDLLDRGIRSGISSEAGSIADKYADIMKEDSALKLGIVGRVKAGKSSFLNALLFGGRDVLPKAATPMTAALTKISYSETGKNEAKVIFYSPSEWDKIENMARECEKIFKEAYDGQESGSDNIKAGLRNVYASLSRSPAAETVTPQKKFTYDEIKKQILANPEALSEQQRASLELFEMARANEVKRGVSVRNLLGQEKIISGDPTQNTAEFMHSLQDYVGADGAYTPIVSYIELSVNDENLKDFVVVDTPGLNDPVTSRSERTNAFLKECHAVLLLSSVTQFLNSADSDLIVRKLEDAGVSKGYIIGTMMDIGVREYDRKSGSFQRDYMASKRVYSTRASEVFAQLAKDGNIISIEKNPEFVSAFLFTIARKRERNQPLNDAEEDLIYWCRKLFPNDADEVFKGSEGCDVFSGFASVQKNIIAPIREQRSEIIAAKIVKFEASTRAMFLRKLEEAIIDAENRLNQIRNSDENSLKARRDACRSCLRNSRHDVKVIFDEIANHAARTINRLKIDIHSLMSEHRHLNITTDIDTHVKSEGWIFKDYYYETTRTRRASAAQASGNIDAFAGEAERLIENEWSDLIDVDAIIGRVKRAIDGAFDAMGQKSGSELTGPLNSVLSGLTVRKKTIPYGSIQKRPPSLNGGLFYVRAVREKADNPLQAYCARI